MRKKYITVVSLLLLAAILAGCCCLQAQQRRLSEKLVRLHVVASSDSEYDQAVKLEVRDAVLDAATALMDGSPDPRRALAEGLPIIEAAAKKRLSELNEDAPVTVTLRNELFPTRNYANFSLPAGVYRSLRVTVGAGEGHNWWCVVFPSICLTASMDELELAAEAAGFSEGEIRLITEDGEGYVLKFKTLELLQKLKNLLFDA